MFHLLTVPLDFAETVRKCLEIEAGIYHFLRFYFYLIALGALIKLIEYLIKKRKKRKKENG